jgi:hypothetical protein
MNYSAISLQLRLIGRPKFGSLLIYLFMGCLCIGCGANSDKSNESSSSNQIRSKVAPKPVDSRFSDFNLQEGECIANDSIYSELGNGIGRTFEIKSAYAQNHISITSMQGDVIKTREKGGCTLYIADYLIDREEPGTNPQADQNKLEFTFITQNKSAIAPALYKTSKKGNFAVGPNIFSNNKAYPMKDNFVGGVKITSITDSEICGEIRLKSKFDVLIIGTFNAPIID